jgi:hypothetical protein
MKNLGNISNKTFSNKYFEKDLFILQSIYVNKN